MPIEPLQPVQYQQNQRISLQDVLPASIPNSMVATNLMKNAGVNTLTSSVPNGSTLTLTTTIVSNLAKSNRIGAVPFQCALFLTSALLNNLIPFGSGVTPSQWVLFGPLAMPEFTPGGTDGNNLIYKSAITNNTGSTQTVIFMSDLRVIQAGKQGL